MCLKVQVTSVQHRLEEPTLTEPTMVPHMLLAAASSLYKSKHMSAQRAHDIPSCTTAPTARGSAQITIMRGDELSFAAASCFTSIRLSIHHFLHPTFGSECHQVLHTAVAESNNTTVTELNYSVTPKYPCMLVWRKSTKQTSTSSLEKKIRK